MNVRRDGHPASGVASVIDGSVAAGFAHQLGPVGAEALDGRAEDASVHDDARAGKHVDVIGAAVLALDASFDGDSQNTRPCSNWVVVPFR